MIHIPLPVLLALLSPFIALGAVAATVLWRDWRSCRRASAGVDGALHSGNVATDRAVSRGAVRRVSSVQ